MSRNQTTARQRQQSFEEPRGASPLAMRRDIDALTGTSADPAVVDARLQEIATKAHLVTPDVRCTFIPEGYAITLNATYVDPARDTYNVQGGLALSKAPLQRIAAQVGVIWDPKQCGFIHEEGDPRHPYLVTYRATGAYQGFDGRWQSLPPGTKRLDLREGSPMVEKMHTEAQANNRSADKQIREMRAFIVEHAESKAINRAIRGLGIRSSYEREELDGVPFVSAKLVWTGASDDPELRRQFARDTRTQDLQARAMLFGGAPPPAPAAPAATFDRATGEVVEAEGVPVSAAAPPDPTPSTEEAELPDGTPLSKAETAKLERWSRRIKDDLEDNIIHPEDVESMTDLRGHIVAELGRREGGEKY